MIREPSQSEEYRHWGYPINKMTLKQIGVDVARVLELPDPEKYGDISFLSEADFNERRAEVLV